MLWATSTCSCMYNLFWMNTYSCNTDQETRISIKKNRVFIVFVRIYSASMPSESWYRPKPLSAERREERLKVLTNEKRGGLAVVSFERSPFKLFSLKFSNKSVPTPSCERPKTTQRTLFLLFANNNCFQLTLYCRKCKKSGKLASHVANSNIAISVRIIALFEKIYYKV